MRGGSTSDRDLVLGDENPTFSTKEFLQKFHHSEYPQKLAATALFSARLL
jgi:hypothetical protein